MFDGTQIELIEKWERNFTRLPGRFRPLLPRSYSVVLNERMRTRAGVCHPREDLIAINPHLTFDPQVFEEVLVHELCHLAVARSYPYARAHGKTWQRLMKHFGFEANRCHTLDTSPRRQKRWEMTCRCRVHMVSTIIRNKIQKGYRYKCKLCSTELT